MDREEDKQLWDLLGQASVPLETSPFFARNVMREVRRGVSQPSLVSRWRTRRVWVPAFAACAALLLTFAGLHLSPWQRLRSAKTAPSNQTLASDDDNQDDDMSLLADVDDDNDDSQLL